jgi:hypothetical protein
VAANLPVLLEDGQSKYVWGRGLLYATNPAGTAVASVYQRDGLGTVRALTDGAGVLTATREVDEFGLPTRSQGPSAQPFGSPGSSATPRPQSRAVPPARPAGRAPDPADHPQPLHLRRQQPGQLC